VNFINWAIIVAGCIIRDIAEKDIYIELLKPSKVHQKFIAVIVIAIVATVGSIQDDSTE